MIILAGSTYEPTAEHRADLLRRAAAFIERVGYVDHAVPGSPERNVIDAVASAAAPYANSAAAFSDGMFLVNSRFLIVTATPRDRQPETWAAFARALDTETACRYLTHTAELVEMGA
jgi:hypothetical protein